MELEEAVTKLGYLLVRWWQSDELLELFEIELDDDDDDDDDSK
jgi:hypothetical protein